MSVLQSERRTERVFAYGVNLLLALAVLLAGLWLRGWLSRRVDAHMARPNVDVTLEPTRRVDKVFGISYGSPIDLARQALEALVRVDEPVLRDPAPVIVVGELTDSAVHIRLRVWTAMAAYWPVYFDMQERVKKRFGEGGIRISFLQRDVHLRATAA